MGNVLDRFRAIFESTANSIADGLEDPHASLDYGLVRLEENRQKVLQSLVAVSTAREALLDQRSRISRDMEKYDRQAEASIQAGREDLARRVLERKQSALLQLDRLEGNLTSIDRQAEELKGSLVLLEQKINNFRYKKEELKSLYDSAQAQLRVREAITGIGNDLAGVGFTIRRVEERIRAMRARAEAIDILVADGFLQDPLDMDDVDRQLVRIDRVQNVENELALLKAEVSQKALSSGQHEGDLPPAN
jgi:phage shock protein A